MFSLNYSSDDDEEEEVECDKLKDTNANVNCGPDSAAEAKAAESKEEAAEGQTRREGQTWRRANKCSKCGLPKKGHKCLASRTDPNATPIASWMPIATPMTSAVPMASLANTSTFRPKRAAAASSEAKIAKARRMDQAVAQWMHGTHLSFSADEHLKAYKCSKCGLPKKGHKCLASRATGGVGGPPRSAIVDSVQVLSQSAGEEPKPQTESGLVGNAIKADKLALAPPEDITSTLQPAEAASIPPNPTESSDEDEDEDEIPLRRPPSAAQATPVSTSMFTLAFRETTKAAEEVRTSATELVPCGRRVEASDASEGASEVAAFLDRANLSCYAEVFESNGFDDLPYLRMLPREALDELLTGEPLRMKRGHAMKFTDYLLGRLMTRTREVSTQTEVSR